MNRSEDTQRSARREPAYLADPFGLSARRRPDEWQRQEIPNPTVAVSAVPSMGAQGPRRDSSHGARGDRA